MKLYTVHRISAPSLIFFKVQIVPRILSFNSMLLHCWYSSICFYSLSQDQHHRCTVWTTECKARGTAVISLLPSLAGRGAREGIDLYYDRRCKGNTVPTATASNCQLHQRKYVVTVLSHLKTSLATQVSTRLYPCRLSRLNSKRIVAKDFFCFNLQLERDLNFLGGCGLNFLTSLSYFPSFMYHKDEAQL